MDTYEKEDLQDLIAPDYSSHTRDQELWSEVVEGLWQGGTSDNDVLHRPTRRGEVPAITTENFDTVVTMYQYAKPVDWFVKEMRYCIYDSTISHIDKEELFDVVKFAHKEWVNGKKVLIRCQAGLNRSGLVMALVLIREGYTPADAVRLIRKNRSSYALCNDEFLEWLLFGINPEDWRAENLVEVAAA